MSDTTRKVLTTITDLPSKFDKFEIVTGDNKKSLVQLTEEESKMAICLMNRITASGKLVNYYLILFNKELLETEKSKLRALQHKILTSVREHEKENGNQDIQITTTFATALLIDEMVSEWRSKQDKKADNAINEDEKVIKDISKLFSDASILDASDIHIEVREAGTAIRLRINGELQLFDKKGNTQGNAMVSSMYNTLLETGTGTSFNPTSPQDALIDNKFNGKRLRFRFASIPADPDGFDGILRLLKLPEDDTSFLTLKQLGYSVSQIQLADEANSQPVGVIIMAGTTGSGKSTTLSNMLKREVVEQEGKIKVITVEDPPEYFMPNTTQIGVKRDSDGDGTKSFQASIRGAMRSDPDILMIGEVRDEQTADMCTSAIQTGHRVLTTIHASSALGIINRLENMGVSRETLSSPDFFAAMMYQKLMKKICPHCSIPLKGGKIPSKYSIERILIQEKDVSLIDINKAKESMKQNKNISLLRALQDLDLPDLSLTDIEEIKHIYKTKNDSVDYDGLVQRLTDLVDIEEHNIRFQNENGCEHCKFSGILGRTVVAEVVRPDGKMLDLISQGKDREVKMYWKRNLGGKTVYDDGLDKVTLGIIDPWEYEDKLTLFGLTE
jgi:type II secretory ATPase GspE/PulE/Tfp pilus assembly ATPase PilB-like protein